MGVAKSQVISALSPPLPIDIITHLLTEYQEIKQQFAFRKFRPSELTGGRFAECIMRLIQHLDNPPFTPFGTQLPNSDGIIRRVENNTTLPDSLRMFIPRLARTLLDVRNRRDVAHVGGDVSPNYADSLFISHTVDWILTELLRIYFQCPVDAARKITDSINEVQIPVIADVDGFLRVQNTNLGVREKCLAILYHKNPSKIRDADLFKWTKYGNSSRFKTDILGGLDKDALIHYENGLCSLLPKGVIYTEKNVALDVIA